MEGLRSCEYAPVFARTSYSNTYLVVSVRPLWNIQRFERVAAVNPKAVIKILLEFIIPFPRYLFLRGSSVGFV